jgi:hypothetical protein
MFKSSHNLFFEDAEWDRSRLFRCFRIGTCEGLWNSDGKYYQILSVVNNDPGNGHFEDVLEWFEQSCRRDKMSLKILEIMNKDFKKHLIEKRNFTDIGNDNLIKIYYDNEQTGNS